MKLGLMSSVCPQQSLVELIETAKTYGYAGIEFRAQWGHRHGIELEASKSDLQRARRQLMDSGIAVSCIATGVRFNSPEAADHLPQRELLHRYIELAAHVGAPYLRTFSDPLPEDAPSARDAVLDLAAASYAAVDSWAAHHGVVVLVETHTNMKAEWARRILDAAKADHLQVLWHIEHHLSRGQSVDDAYGLLQGHIRHVHFSAQPGTVAEMPPGAASPNARMFELLAAEGFAGFFSVEIINPDDDHTVLVLHADKYATYVAAADAPRYP